MSSLFWRAAAFGFGALLVDLAGFDLGEAVHLAAFTSVSMASAALLAFLEA